jgi:hypothetical protein
MTIAAACGAVVFAACSAQSPAAPNGLQTSLGPGLGETAQSAQAASPSTAPMRVFSTGVELSGTSTLVRNDNGVSMTIHADGLVPHHAYTAWIVAFNDPAGCSDGICDVQDVLNNRGVPAVRYGGGHVVGGSGKANIGGHLAAGNTGGLACAAGPSLGSCGPGLLEPRSAIVHLVLRTHGEAQPELLPEQISSFNGGCPPNACANVQFAEHRP